MFLKLKMIYLLFLNLTHKYENWDNIRWETI